MVAGAGRLYSDLKSLGRTAAHTVRGSALRALVYLTLSSLVDGLSVVAVFPVLKLLVTAGRGSVEVFPGMRLLGRPVDLRLSLEMLLISLVALVAIRAWLLRQRDVASSAYGVDLMTELRRKLFECISRCRWDYIQSQRISAIQNVLNVEVMRAQITVIYLLTLVQSAVTLVIFVGVSMWVSPLVTLTAALCGAVALVCLSPIRRRAHLFGQGLGERNETQARIIADFLNGLKVAKSMNAEPVFRRRFGTILESNQRAYVQFTSAKADGGASLQVASAVVAAGFLYGSFRYLGMPFDRTAAILIIFSRIVPRFTALQTSAQEIMTNISAFSAYERLLGACQAAAEPAYLPKAEVEVVRSIQLSGVTFAHRTRDGAHALKDVDLELSVGSITALIGPSGSGKSTIADILMGLLTPAAGCIRLDGRELKEVELRCWREQIGYVPQEGLLLNDTIIENLTLGLSRAVEEDELWSALRRANAEGLVRGLPDGLNTEVGERGALLSGGERQRIVLARALLRRPKLLILDEATSALDWENQEMIARSIASLRGETTVLTIAHRVSMIAFADQVVAIANGSIVESGTFAELAAKPGSELARVIEGEAAEVG